jgi:hypothetical protein
MAIAAWPAPDVTDLPGGWYWWRDIPQDAPDRDDVLEIAQGTEEWHEPQDVALLRAAQADSIPEQVVSHAPQCFTRRLDRDALERMARDLTAAYAGDEDARASALLGILPDGWRRLALSRAGYNAHGHDDLLGPASALEDSLVQTAETKPAEDGYGPWQPAPTWWRIARAPWRKLGDGRWDHPTLRIARAPAGTMLPEGWHEVLDPGPRVPVHVDEMTALDAAQLRWQPSELTTVTITEQPTGRWSYGLGTGGHLRVLGERPTQQEAAAAGTAAHSAATARAWERYRARFGDDLSWAGLPAEPPPPQLVIRELSDVVGIKEIARRLGVQRATGDQWRQRGILPASLPRQVGGRDAWSWPVIEQWAIETGRLGGIGEPDMTSRTQGGPPGPGGSTGPAARPDPLTQSWPNDLIHPRHRPGPTELSRTTRTSPRDEAGPVRERAGEAAYLAAGPPWATAERLGGYSSLPAADQRRWDRIADAARRHAGSPKDAAIAMYDAWRAGEGAQSDAPTSFSGLISTVKDLWRDAARAAIAVSE